MTPYFYPLKPFVLATQAQVDFVGPATALPATVPAVSTDTRSMGEGDLFVALRGERFDGHDHVLAAQNDGAAAAVVEAARVGAVRQAGVTVPVLGVTDTLVAYGDIARAHRLSLRAKIAAVCGANGKTSTRTMLAAIFATIGPTVQNEANHNNRVGVPQTLLALRPEHAFAAIELGTNLLGEVAELARITEPNTALVTVIHPEHTEGLKDLESVAREEFSVFDRLGPHAMRIVNRDDPLSWGRPEVRMAPVLSFGAHADSNVRLIETVPLGLTGQRVTLAFEGARFSFNLPFIGRHNALNAAAACAAAFALGVPVARAVAGLEACVPPKARMATTSWDNHPVLDDTYNANPGSMVAAVDTAETLFGHRRWVAVLGEMRELGALSATLHGETGEKVAALKPKAVFVFGAGARPLYDALRVHSPATTVSFGEDPAVAALFVRQQIDTGDGLLLKGSRGLRVERVLEQLRAGLLQQQQQQQQVGVKR